MTRSQWFAERINEAHKAYQRAETDEQREAALRLLNVYVLRARAEACAEARD